MGDQHSSDQACLFIPTEKDPHGEQIRIGLRNSFQEKEDPYEFALNKTGCKELNEALLECYYDHKDWRKCQSQVLTFKACFEAYQRNLNKNI